MRHALLAIVALLAGACAREAGPAGRPCASDDDCPTGVCFAGTCRTALSDGSAFCLDRDHDGHGSGCALGPDCDDRDAVQGGTERCDGRDNDCDARADEDVVTSACGDCDSSCDVVRRGADDGVAREPFALEASSRDVRVDGDGSLLLDGALAEPLDLAWIASSDGTIAKIDTRRPALLARYRVSPDPRGVPARGVAVAANGDALVTTLDARVLRFAASADDCVDRDGDGAIQTAGARAIAWDAEECRIAEGTLEGQPGAIAVRLVRGPDGEAIERVFAGTEFVEGTRTITLVELDPRTLAELGRMTVDALPESETTGLTPNDLEIDARGQLWVVSSYGTVFGAPGATLARVDTGRCPGDAECALPCDGADGDGCAVQRMFLPGLGTSCATLDAAQRLWLADYDDGLVYAWDASRPYGGRIALLTPTPLALPIHGLAADRDQRLWAAIDGALWAFDIAAMEEMPLARIGDRTLAITSVLVDPLARGWGLSTHGAATIAAIEGREASVVSGALGELGETTAWCADGAGASIARERGPQGLHVARIEACPGGAPRGAVRWRWLALSADVPAGAFVGLRVRTGEPAAIERAPWIMVPSVERLDLAALFARTGTRDGTLLDVELVLRATTGARPRVRWLDVARSADCAPLD